MKPVYERCMEVCNEKGACQHPSGCMASFLQAASGHLLATGKTSLTMADLNEAMQKMKAGK